ncbi:MAG: imidazoleglycerol-phosphate dehydratase [Spirochaetaceae bacterium]|jgi:imidazoleglycerol-phosphate dehydratase|nr:imidazoleglycerol-phosphate dehydratase [Spirochaetaceae bacterium]
MNRTAETARKTAETDIFASLNLDGTGKAKLDYPIGFMTHMLTAFAKHGLFDIELCASGDLEVDQHHLIEDTGITLGQCFAKALGEKRGIRRVGSCLYPMDETLARAAADISGRPFLVCSAALSGVPLISAPVPGRTDAAPAHFQTDTVEDFWQGFVSAALITLHLDILRGRSDHHKIEALFKAAARALREAAEIDERTDGSIPSTKGTLAGPLGIIV